MIIDPIPLSGPSITQREIEYAADAAATGWNARATLYVQRLQTLMAGYAGQRYALATSSGTAAIHLALLAMGIKRGDEVLLPELADFSLASCVLHVGATPVFCDVDARTLCLDPDSAAARISPRTRCMAIAHMYGQPCDMTVLLELAKRHKLLLLEDATQGLGSLYQNRPAGSFGHFSLFSFHNTNPVAAGEGGMLLCSSREHIALADKLGSGGRSAADPQIHDLAGYNYGMSNLSAAVALAQMERVDEILQHKGQVFDWYAERLRDIPGLGLNSRRPGIGNSRWMPLLFLDRGRHDPRDFQARLQRSRVLAGRISPPLSSMPLFRGADGSGPQSGGADNPVAHDVAGRVFVLPGGNNLLEEDVDYVCGVIRALLADSSLPSATARPTGWLGYKSDLLEFFARIRQEGFSLPFTQRGADYALQLVRPEDLLDPERIAFFTRLRRDNQPIFLVRVPVSEQGTRELLTRYIAGRDTLLFVVTGPDGLWGQVGLESFDYQKRECKLDALIMRDDAPAGVGAAACDALFAWAKNTLGLKRIFNHIVGSNDKSRLLAAAHRFTSLHRMSLYKESLAEKEVVHPMYVPGHETPDETLVISVKEL
jgi:perosamine synthetase